MIRWPPPEHAGPAALVLIVGLAAAVRAGAVAYSPGAWVTGDTETYLSMAQSILQGEPYAYFPNGFPLLILGVWHALSAFGAQADLLPALAALNVLLSTAIVVLAWGIARAFVGRAGALLAALGVALWPNQINYTRQLLTEVPATFLLLLGVLLLLRRRPLWAGIVLYSATMVRTSLLPIAILGVAWLAWADRSWRAAALGAVGLALPFGIQQALLLSGVIASPTNAGVNLLVAVSGRSTDGVVYGGRGFSAAEQLDPLGTYLRFAWEHPGEFWVQRFSAFWEMWGPWPEAGLAEQPRPWWVRLLIGLRFPLVAVAVAEAVRGRTAEHVLLVTPVLVLTAVHFVFFSTARFSYPAEPFAIILAVSALVWVWQRRAPRRAALSPAG